MFTFTRCAPPVLPPPPPRRDGDEYIGGCWNTLSLLYLTFMLAPAAAGLFAWLSYGKLWATGEYY